MIYVIIIHERHSNTDVELFEGADAAIDRAVEIVRGYAGSPEDVDEELTESMRQAGWLYYGTWSPEADYVIVVEREVN